MGSGKLYSRPANTKKNVKGNRFVRSFLFAGILLISMPFVSKATPNTAPVFVTVNTQLLVCENTAAVSLTSYLTVSDPDTNQTETWSIVTGPTAGTLDGFTGPGFTTQNTTGPTGGITAPIGLTYTPNTGYAGPDQFTINVDDGNGGSSTITINVVVDMPPSLILGTIPAVCAGATSVTIPFTGLQNVGPTTTFFGLVGATQWNVPPGVTNLSFDVMGAVGGQDNHSGAPNPGKGGRVQGSMPVTPFELLNLYVGGSGGNGTVTGAAGGWNGGGNAYFYFFGCGGAGGGGTDIRVGGTGLTNRVVVAGGGGGNGWDAPGPFAGGAGGNNISGDGGNSQPNIAGSPALGGTPSAGGGPATYAGNPSGTGGVFGTGGNGSVKGISGGGGGGWYGGGGGVWNGGGGGSSFTAPGITGVTHTQGYNNGDGQIVFNYTIPGTYMIQWDVNAQSAGFPATQSGTLPATPITISLPPGAPAANYNGILTISNPLCTSIQYPIVVTINPIPDVMATDDQTVCNGNATTEVDFSGSVEATTFKWMNNNAATGLADSGMGSIPSFTAANATSGPISSRVIVTPMANGCSGTPDTFMINVNPSPSLTVPGPFTQCNIVTFDYNPASGTPGTSFIWNRAAVPGISNPTGSGGDNPDELLVNTTAFPIVVPYIYTMAASGCNSTQEVDVTVYPTPLLSTSLTPPAVCSGNTFNYSPTSATPGTTFTWNRNPVPGISNSAATGTNNPGEALVDTTTDPAVVTYVYTLIANGCSWTQNVTVTVNPTPVLNSSTTPPALCNQITSTYEATSATAGSTFTWSRASVPGIADPSNSGIGAIPGEALNNTSTDPVVATYAFTIQANGCSNTENVMQTINPKPLLTNSLNPQVCDGLVFSYPAASATAGTTFIWDRNAVAGISNIAASGIGNPNETLHNTTTHPVVDTYAYTLMANGCSNTQYVKLTVNPTPRLSSTLFPTAICDSNVFNYTATSATAGTTFSWDRPYIPGIYAVQQTGIGNVSQQLINSTYVPVDVTYMYALMANGCVDTENVVVSVNPTPKLTGPFTGTVCSGSPFSYAPVSLTPGATFAWNRPQTDGITPPTSFGTGGIHEAVTNADLVPLYVQYIYRLGINGCINLYTQTVTVKVNPTPPAPVISTASPSSVCDNTLNQTFGAQAPATAPVLYTWSATNASVWVTGAGNQYAIVNFTTPGQAVVTLSANVSGINCFSSTNYDVNVSSSESETATVIYTNGQFICLKNDNGSYQWGYDDAVTLSSTTLTGEINQNYINNNPDFGTRHYWVIINKDGCAQKSYYNAPTGLTNVNADQTDVKVFPNPTSASINVEINTTVGGKMQVEILNMLGQKLSTQPVNNNKTTVDVSSLPAGCYLVDCYRDGIKIANARFIKN